ALAVMAGAYTLARGPLRLAPSEAGVHALASTFGNAVFLGLPIALSVEGWARPFVILMLVEGIVIIGVGAALIDRRGGEGGFAARAGAFVIRPLRNPLVVAAVAGFAFASLGGDLPEPVRRMTDILGRAAGGTALFSLGLFFATRPLPKFGEVGGAVAAIAFLKMGVLPILTLASLHLVGVTDAAHVGAAALFTATPVAVGTFVMANQYKAYERQAAAAIAATTALALLTISAVLVVFA
ncbi:MAG: AEC family transporter, partial [Parvularculaceae bacterium]|nr:AEC family transporter [Parvularculaceae bacterium]